MSSHDLELLREGRKRCTIRLGTAAVATPLLIATDGAVSVPVRITRVVNDRNLKDLTDLDARDEGFDSLAELLSDLKQYYPNATPDDRITVIYLQAINDKQ